MPLLSNLDWGNWAYGLWVAVVGGGANAVTAGIGLLVIDPKDFNLQQGKLWGLIGGLFVLSAVKDFFLYLSQNPAPKIITTMSATVKTEASGASVATLNKTTERPAPQEVESKP